MPDNKLHGISFALISYMRKKLSLFVYLLVFGMTKIQSSWADSNIFNRPFYKVTPESRTQVLIDSSIESIFKSQIKNDLCSVYQNEFILAYSLGITQSKAKQIYQSCPVLAPSDMKLAKRFRKQYLVGFDNDSSLDIISWTSKINKTYIFVNNELSKEDLSHVLVHEMAISLDAKMNMYYTTYMSIEGLYPPSIGKINGVYLPPNLSASEDNLRIAFNSANYKPIAYTFAAMRAFNVESMVENKNTDTINNQQACKDTFNKLFPLFENSMDEYEIKPKNLDINDMLMSMLDEKQLNISPANLKTMLETLLDEHLLVEKPNKISFCQYMATPKLTNKTFLSLFASGPRPRIGGGWNSDPKQIGEDINLDLHEHLIKEED
jgi:hypothetical protein